MATRVAIPGGTGGLGRALALRACASGHPVVIGSRTVERAEATAAELRSLLPGAQVIGLPNVRAVEGSALTVLSIPFDGVDARVVDGAHAASIS